MNRRFLLCALCLPIPMAVAGPMKTDGLGNPVLTQFSEEGFVDCVFRIVERKETPTHYILTLRAVHEGRVVGFAATVLREIQAGLDASANLIKAHVYRNGVVFSRTGPESDLLLVALSEQYGRSSPSIRMTKTEPYTAIALHQGSIDMTKEPVKLKLFGRESDPSGAAAYYESYFNLDLAAGLVFWNEKDQEYRKPLLRALGE